MMKERNDGFTYQNREMITDQWLTPPHIINSLGLFDLDPCSPIDRPWDTAKRHLNINDNGLIQEWYGRVWMNPPYGVYTGMWLEKLKNHGNGIALIFARTETKMFFDHVWDDAYGLLFIKGRIRFHHVNGEQAKQNGGSPSVLIAYGKGNFESLMDSGIEGKLIQLKGLSCS